MKVFSNIHCYTKSGPVVWTFYKLNNLYVATNGEDTIIKKTYLELKAVKARFLTYKTSTGARRFYPGLPKKQMLVADPWESQLPLDMQQQLAALA